MPDVSGVAVDIKLFHESGCRLVHRYRIYGDPLPHPALQGRVIKKLLAFVNRIMAIAWLTHLHLSIPSSGTTSGPVPLECFPVVPLSQESAVSRRVFAALVFSGGGARIYHRARINGHGTTLTR